MNRFLKPRTSEPVGRLDIRERMLLLATLGLVLVAALAPALPDPSAAVGLAFADGRSWHGLPHAMDVLSNAPFAVLGLWGLWRVHPLHAPRAGLACARLFFIGLLCTAAGSVVYHLAPDALRLAADRGGMAIAFAGMIGLAVGERISARAGAPAAGVALVGGLLAVAICQTRGDVLPWAVVQFGGMALVLVLAWLSPTPGAVGLQLGVVIAFYALAKLFELGDAIVYDLSGALVSGHSLKHLVAAGAAWPVLRAVQALRREALRHNPRAAALTA